MKMPKSQKTQKTLEVIERLKSEFGVAGCALHYDNVFQLLVATILSAQCTDERVNQVCYPLFQKLKTPEDFAKVSLLELEVMIRPTGFFRNKAKNIQASSKILVEKFNSEVPQNMSDLLTLPGVARKTANVVLGVGYGLNEGVVVDTHVGRIVRRLGLTKNENPVLVEKDLLKLVPRDYWTQFSLILILHGRKTCKSQKPKCRECNLVDLCPFGKANLRSN